MAAGDPLQPPLHGHPLRRHVDLAALARHIGYGFVHRELALEALTHRSALDGRPDLKAAFPDGNERLEFLGDRVLSLAVAHLLMRRFPREPEGPLARRHAELVSSRTLAEVAEEAALRPHLVLPPEAPPPTPAILADAMEALLGAVFLDGGFPAALEVVESLWGRRLESHRTAPRPPKAHLQEWTQARGLGLPFYREVRREGTEHAPLFVMEVTVDGLPAAQGQGKTKRDAETAAAASLLQRLEKA